MDAVLFIILIGIVAVIVVQSGNGADDEDRMQDLGEACDTVFESRMFLSDLQYSDEEDRMMKFTDICAVSLALEDGRARQYIADTLEIIYPWEGSFSFTLGYNGHTAGYGTYRDGWIGHIVKEYDFEYGGTLEAEFYLYG